MSNLVIRIKPEQKIMIAHNGEILSFVIYKNNAGTKFSAAFDGPSSFIIDREEGFKEKTENYKGNNENNISK
jgi:hypothetical protein